MIVVPHGGAARLLARQIGRLPNGPVTLRLFANDVEPDLGDEVDRLREVAAYTPLVIPPSEWMVQFGPPARIVAHPRTFVFTRASGPIHGYYVTDDLGELLWLERFDRPHEYGPAGGELDVEPRFAGMTMKREP